MAVLWTDNQRDAIDARRGTILVSAAAGSGKTAVLVERAAQRLTDSENPTAADKMLIVTFTKAAAAEMRARLEKKIYDMLRADPKNTMLKRQAILLSQANIGTVDSFCAGLVREFFHVLNISPDFKIISDKQRLEMMNEALNECIDEAFEGKAEMRGLADAFASERDDRRLMEMVVTLYEFTQSHPFPKKWLNEKVSMYNFSGRIGDSPWGEVILKYAEEAAWYCINMGDNALSEMREDEKLEAAYFPVFSADSEIAKAILNHSKKGEWDKLNSLFGALKFQTLRTPKGYNEDPLKIKLKAVRDDIKGVINDLVALFVSSEQECAQEFTEIGNLLLLLAELTLKFSERFEEKKLTKDFLDYSDLEHLALNLLLDENGARTAESEEISRRFDEIMIDEFQDINEVQNALFKAVSRNENNIFMVGDVKQSIYGFRRAMPDIFISSKNSMEKYSREADNYPSYIVLDRNFRSRRNVTESVNFVFSQLMSTDAGDIEYNDEEELVFAADYEENLKCDTVFDILERDETTPVEILEAAHIAERIKTLIADGLTVQSKNGARPASFGDFCILLRSANKYAARYAAELQNRGVSAKAALSGGFFAATEISVMLSMLRVIDNPNQNIPLLAVLMSPIYGFTADDMVKIKMNAGREDLYISLVRSAETDPKSRAVLEDIRNYRALSATMSSDSFISFLLEKSGYSDIVLAMAGGEIRLANLHLLQRYARDYESSGYNGISGFVRFMDRLKQNNSDMEAAQAVSENDDSVQIMSIHKSKGLEFPVCIIAGCGRGFNGDRSEVALHPDLGLGIKLKDRSIMAKFTTMPREAIALETARNSASEELRILYVAMTRAREKLIMVGSLKNPEKILRESSSKLTEGKNISPYIVRNSASFAHWLILCALRHPSAENIRKSVGIDDTPLYRENFTPWEVNIVEPAERESSEAEEERAEEKSIDEELFARIKERINYVYPFAELSTIPTKVTASKLTVEGKSSSAVLSRPAWLGAKGMTPAERGIALHDFMQYADFKTAAENPQAEIKRLLNKKFLTQEQADAVDLDKVHKFFKSEIGKRVLSSSDVRRERRFTAEIPANLIRDDISEENGSQPVILQGAVDCTFMENGKLNIIDFKTDRVQRAEELWEKYGVQIRLYSKAMEQVTGCEIGDLILYSMYLSEGMTGAD